LCNSPSAAGSKVFCFFSSEKKCFLVHLWPVRPHGHDRVTLADAPAGKPQTPPTPKRTAIFTICSNNYIAFARVLHRSVQHHHPEADFFLCLADTPLDTPDFYRPEWTVVEASLLDIPDFRAFSFRYDIMEFNTAVKPFMFIHLLQEFGYDQVIYFDPDIQLFRPVSPVTDLLARGASFVFTPHLCSPSEGRQEPNDVTIMRAGVFNLGFLAVSRCEETAGVLQWWARRLRTQCINAQAEGLFVDQKFMNLVPGFAPRTAICRDTTLNVAYWNLGQRRLASEGQGWSVDGRPLTFFHFSGFNPAAPVRLSKHDPRFNGNLSEALGRLTSAYAQSLYSEGHRTHAQIPYAYGRYRSGSMITPDARRRFRELRHWEGDPFENFEFTATC
jgi:hypothetical protein